ncbi:MAG: hypothetical protein CMF42_05450 [Legionellales bacterium]|nr:hypothetical protein [Legionellales bacterium]OUX66858.1 MAG: hypothetical protein CBD38_03795 [bacterium TMED178]
MNSKPLIIIGTGAAGTMLASTWRRLDPTRTLIMLTQNNGDYYHKPMLSTIFSKEKTLDDLVTKTAQDLSEELNAKVYTKTSVVAIDTELKQIKTNTDCFEYGDCVLAIGSETRTIPHECESHFQINDLDDYRKLWPSLEKVDSVQIVGAGLIGCELTHDLAYHGKKITLISNTPYPLAEFAPEAIGIALKKHFIDRGIQYQYDPNPKIDPNQLTVFTVGLKHNTQLFPQFDQSEQGFKTNRFGQTNIDHVYAIGDCAQMSGINLRYIGPIRATAAAMSNTLCQQPTPIHFDAMPVAVKTHDYPIVVCKHPTISGKWQLEKNDAQGIIYSQMSEENQKIGYALTSQYCELRTKMTLPPWVA